MPVLSWVLFRALPEPGLSAVEFADGEAHLGSVVVKPG